jgi:hypothetical protein
MAGHGAVVALGLALTLTAVGQAWAQRTMLVRFEDRKVSEVDY